MAERKRFLVILFSTYLPFIYFISFHGMNTEVAFIRKFSNYLVYGIHPEKGQFVININATYQNAAQLLVTEFLEQRGSSHLSHA